MMLYNCMGLSPPRTLLVASWMGPGPGGPPSMLAMDAAAVAAAAAPTGCMEDENGAVRMRILKPMWLQRPPKSLCMGWVSGAHSEESFQTLWIGYQGPMHKVLGAPQGEDRLSELTHEVKTDTMNRLSETHTEVDHHDLTLRGSSRGSFISFP
eukprot:1141639-Pelagomonas_calceolata.AAC.3